MLTSKTDLKQQVLTNQMIDSANVYALNVKKPAKTLNCQLILRMKSTEQHTENLRNTITFLRMRKSLIFEQAVGNSKMREWWYKAS